LPELELQTMGHRPMATMALMTVKAKQVTLIDLEMQKPRAAKSRQIKNA
jgi:hypothetical protein